MTLHKTHFSSAQKTPRVIRGRFVSFDGTLMRYESVGQGPPLVFCYGLVCNQRSYRYQREYFQHHYQCIFFDYRGHQSLKHVLPSSKTALQNIARDIYHLTQHLGLDQVTLIGHSMGVNVTFHYFLKYPKRVSALIWINGLLHNPFAYMFRHEISDVAFSLLRDAYLKFPEPFAVGWEFVTKHKWMPTLLTVPFGFNMVLSEAADMKNYIEGVIDTPHTTLMEHLIQWQKRDDRKHLKKLKGIPVLMCAGQRDVITPLELQRQLADRVPHATFIKVPQGSHNAHLDMPAFVNHKMKQFLKQHIGKESN